MLTIETSACTGTALAVEGWDYSPNHHETEPLISAALNFQNSLSPSHTPTVIVTVRMTLTGMILRADLEVGVWIWTRAAGFETASGVDLPMQHVLWPGDSEGWRFGMMAAATDRHSTSHSGHHRVTAVAQVLGHMDYYCLAGARLGSRPCEAVVSVLLDLGG